MCEFSVVSSQLIALFFYFIIIVLALELCKKDIYSSTTIYTQAIEDWNSAGWKDFFWQDADKTCEENKPGAKPIGHTWLGTVKGRHDDDGIRAGQADKKK